MNQDSNYALTKYMFENYKIRIKPGKDADTRSCPDVKAMTKERLHAASVKHMGDIHRGMAFFASMLGCYANSHDRDKVEDIDGFLSNFHTNFEEKDWLERHYEKNRHHLENPDAIPEDVNLIDVLDHITDQVMSSMARGFERPIDLSDELLQKAVANTEKLLRNVVEVEDA